jgi:phytoene dehydrogenase-like protein
MWRMSRPTGGQRARGATDDYDAIVVGAGHNGLVCAAYLAKGGLRTLLLEARAGVGGVAASDHFAGATVNICNCDHITFRTTPIADELDLARFGLRYLDIEPAQVSTAWSGGPPWRQWHDVDRTIDELAATHPGEVAGYRRYLRTARPAAELIVAAAVEPPTISRLTRAALSRRFAGTTGVLRWGRRSAADVLRSFFTHDAVLGPALVSGPFVWGVSPERRGTGLGALTYAMRHTAQVGRPVGGSGRLTDALAAAVTHHGGTLRTSSPVARILCTAESVAGVALADGTEITAPVVVSACDARRTFVDWLRDPPSGAAPLIARWRRVTSAEGYESKIDAVVTEPPQVLDGGDHLGSTLTIAPSILEMDRAVAMMSTGHVLRRPALLVNVPSLSDPTIAPAGRHVLSIEVLLTPYRHPAGWVASREPRRWLEVFAERCAPGFLDSIVEWRAVTPDVYEREFNLPAGHAASFGGGPVAALRNRSPELTKYETAMPGLYLTGAATFPGAGIWGASGRNCAAVVLGRGR